MLSDLRGTLTAESETGTRKLDNKSKRKERKKKKASWKRFQRLYKQVRLFFCVSLQPAMFRPSQIGSRDAASKHLILDQQIKLPAIAFDHFKSQLTASFKKVEEKLTQIKTAL